MELVEMISDLAATPEELFDLYRRLPPPRITYVPSSDRRAFLQRLSVVGKSSSTRSLKFLSVLDDMHAVGFKVSRKQWTSAIHLAGRAMPTVRWKEAESALRVWKEMEEGAGLRGDTVTFNVLLDIAIRAERLPLVEMILHEMAERQLSIDRFGHTAIICYHGIRQDGDAIRRAYKTLVSSGEVVDTLVLNAVMAALLRAGEASAADEVLHRMKDLHTRRTDIESPLLSPIHWEAPKDMTSTLHLLASDTHALDQNIPAAQSLAPDSHTYSIFLHHHANRTGELARVASLLDEMQRAGLPPRGRMYLDLLRGFFLHGGVRYSAWTAPRLESVWSSYLAVLDAGAPDVTAGRWIAIWAVRAFARCVGRERSLEVWAEMRCRWTPAQGDEEVVLGRVWELAASARE